MSLYRPFFRVEPNADGWRITHNCNGNIGFAAHDIIDDDTRRLIELAIEEGKRRKALEVCIALGVPA